MMKNITTKQFCILSDFMAVYSFMLEIYQKDWKNGVPAPFLEYALSSDWMDTSLMHRARLWLDGDKIVAFCFMENPVTDTYFSLRPGYEELAPEMVEYAKTSMPGAGKNQQLVLFSGQTALLEAAEKAGYQKTGGYQDMTLDLASPLPYSLPEGYRFAAQPLDGAKILECCWKGFNHEAEEGPWDGDTESALRMSCAPHFTGELAMAVEDESGNYVCYAGMWWTPENNLAYMEPLCTVPEHRRKGLAAALLAELGRRMAALGATHMTGGGDPFYAKIGYKEAIGWNFYKLPSKESN